MKFNIAGPLPHNLQEFNQSFTNPPSVLWNSRWLQSIALKWYGFSLISFSREFPAKFQIRTNNFRVILGVVAGGCAPSPRHLDQVDSLGVVWIRWTGNGNSCDCSEGIYCWVRWRGSRLPLNNHLRICWLDLMKLRRLSARSGAVLRNSLANAFNLVSCV